MKFIKTDESYAEYDEFADFTANGETGKPRRLPSYYDYAKRQSAKNAKRRGNQSSFM